MGSLNAAVVQALLQNSRSVDKSSPISGNVTSRRDTALKFAVFCGQDFCDYIGSYGKIGRRTLL